MESRLPFVERVFIQDTATLSLQNNNKNCVREQNESKQK